LQAVYNALVYTILNYAVLNLGRTSKTAIQPRVTLQINKHSCEMSENTQQSHFVWNLYTKPQTNNQQTV